MIILSKVRKRKTNTIWYNLDVESKWLYKWTYQWNRNRIRDIENSVVVANGEDGGRGFDWELLISIYKLAYIEWVKNKFLLYTTEKLYSILCDKL